MDTLVDRVAHVMYNADAYIPWDKALEEDRSYYLRSAEVVIDTVIGYLESSNEAFHGALTPAIEIITIQTESARLRRDF